MNDRSSISLTSHQDTNTLRISQKMALSIVAFGLLIMGYYWLTFQSEHAIVYLLISLSSLSVGSLWFTYALYKDSLPGIQNNGIWIASLTSRGVWAWILGVFLTIFYVLLYWFPALLGQEVDGGANTGLIGLFDPLSYWIKNQPASQWFVYGTLYTLVIALLGIKFIYKYRHNRYQVYRTLSIIFFQTVFAFILPEILVGLNLPYNDFKNVWPLNYYFFFDWNIDQLIQSGLFGYFVLFWGIIMFLIITPILTYFYGKRWYCSWVCGCGGLAETAGDSFRHLSDKSVKAWRLERIMIYSVLIFVTVMTLAVLIARFTGIRNIFFIDSGTLSGWYGFFIGAVFSGVVGVGFYPILGNRVWCRFGCPMAAYLGLLQRISIKLPWKKQVIRLSKFRITTNGGQCISCGNCSTYCEMGIDVRSYAQEQKDIIRASCVGCGICSAVCPRGVLRLENL